MNSPVKLLTKGGETRLLLERDQKRDQAKGKALEIFPKHFVVSRAQKTSISIFRSSSSVCCPPKSKVHVWDSLPYPTECFSFTPVLRVCTGGWSYADVRTEIFSLVVAFAPADASLSGVTRDHNCRCFLCFSNTKKRSERKWKIS